MNARSPLQNPKQQAPGFNPVPAPASRQVAFQSARDLPSPARLVGNFCCIPLRAKLEVNQPGDVYEHEADVVADEIMKGKTATSLISARGENKPDVQRDEAPGPKSDAEKYKEGAKKIGEAFLQTPLGKELKEKVLASDVVKAGENFVGTLPGKIIVGAAAVGTVSALAATHSELPMQIPEIPLDRLLPGLSVQITYKGPVDKPTEASISFKFAEQPPKSREKKPGLTRSEKQREENARVAAEDEKFRAHMHYPAGSAEAYREDSEKELIAKAAASLRKGPDVDAIAKKFPYLQKPAPGPSLQLGTPAPGIRYKPPALLGDELKLKPIDSSLLDDSASKKKEEATPVSRKATDGRAVAVPAVVDQVLRSPGEALDANSRAFMEARFGRDFSHVRIHTDARATQSAQMIRARAYTSGSDIVFAPGQFDQGKSESQRLLAHELTHVIQQQNGRGGNPRDAEAEARGAAALVPNGAAVHVRAGAGHGLQRDAEVDAERDKIVGVTKRTGNVKFRAFEFVWRMLTRYFPEYSPNVAGVTYEEKTPGIRADVREIVVQGKKVQSATVIVGKTFVESASEETLREHIMQLGESLSALKPIPDPQAASGASTVWKIIQDKFPKKGHRLAGSSYDANLPGLTTEFKGGSTPSGKVSWSAPKLYYGKAFLALPDSDKQSRLEEELKRVDVWCVENGKLVAEDLQDEDITLRIRGLTNSALVDLRDKVKDQAVKQYVESLLTTSTPLGQGLEKQMDGSARVVTGNVTVVVLPDDRNVTTINTPGATNFALPAQRAVQYSWDRQGIITRVTPPPSLTITIQTRYRPGSSAETKSGYGRGTTKSDQAVEAKTLRVHEGSHGVEYLALILKANQDHPYPPTFTGKVGDARADFEAKLHAFEAARNAFVNAVNAGRRPATREVDCVGLTIDEYNQRHNIHEAAMCR